MSVLQPMYRSGARYTSQARAFIASARIPSALLWKSTIEVRSNEPVLKCVAGADTRLAGMMLAEGQYYWVVRSTKFTDRAYIVTIEASGWVCSSKEEPVNARCIAAVEAYRKEQKAA